MKSLFPAPMSGRRFACVALLAGGFALAVCGASPESSSHWKGTGELAVRFTYDSNVYLQDTPPSPTVPGAVPASVGSLVTSVSAKANVDFKPSAGFNIAASYSPELTFFENAHGEDHVTHRAGLRLHGVVGVVTWQFQHSLTVISGNDEGPTFGGVGGAPAIGGIPLRDRRDAIIYRNSFTAFHRHGRWFFRPAASSYVHDFRTEVRDPVQFPNYQNFLDRNDLNVGLDAGYKAFADGYLFLAYRWGWQHEPKLPRVSYDYSNNYRRLLVGFEGRITRQTKLNLFVGPDWREFNHRPPEGFDPNPRLTFIEGNLVHDLSKRDSVALTVRRFVQPAYGAASAYADITYEGVFRRVINDKVSAHCGFKAYAGQWLEPVMRRDWIYTTSAGISARTGNTTTAELAWSIDRAQSDIPDKPGREFTRHLVSVGLRSAF